MFYKQSVEIWHQSLFQFLGFLLSAATCAHGKVFGFLHAVPSTWPPRCTAGVVADGAYWSWDRTIASPIYITWTIGGTFLKPTGHLQLLWLVEKGRLSCFEMASCQFSEPPSVCPLSHSFLRDNLLAWTLNSPTLLALFDLEPLLGFVQYLDKGACPPRTLLRWWLGRGC